MSAINSMVQGKNKDKETWQNTNNQEIQEKYICNKIFRNNTLNFLTQIIQNVKFNKLVIFKFNV